MDVARTKDDVTLVLDSLCEDIREGAAIPNPHVLTMAMRKLFGSKLWMPKGEIFEIRKTVPPSWGTDVRVLDERQSSEDVVALASKISSYV